MSQVVMMLEPELVWLNVLLQPTSLPPHHKPLEDLTFQILDDFGPLFFPRNGMQQGCCMALYGLCFRMFAS